MNNTMNRTMARTAATLLILVGATMAVTSGAISVLYAKEAGWWVIVAFLGAEVGEFFVPVIAGTIGWNRYLKTITIICTLASSVSIFSYLMDVQAVNLVAQGNHTVARQDANASHDTANADANRARTVLGKLEPMGLGDVVSLETLANEADKAAERESGRGGCKKKCEAYKVTAADHRAKLALAKDRDAAKKALADANKTLATAEEVRKTVTEESSGLALILKTYLNVPTNFTDTMIVFVRAIMALVLLKLLTYMTIPGMVLLNKLNEVKETIELKEEIDVEALRAEIRKQVEAEFAEPKTALEQLLDVVDDANIAQWADAIAAMVLNVDGLISDIQVEDDFVFAQPVKETVEAVVVSKPAVDRSAAAKKSAATRKANKEKLQQQLAEAEAKIEEEKRVRSERSKKGAETRKARKQKFIDRAVKGAATRKSNAMMRAAAKTKTARLKVVAG